MDKYEPRLPMPEGVAKEVGLLCSAWAYLEFLTETAIWKLLEIETETGKWLTWKLDMRFRWELLLDIAKEKVSQQDLAELKEINKLVVDLTKDRNIVIHGLIHRMSDEETPSWVIFKGARAARRYKVSVTAMQMINENISKVIRRFLKNPHVAPNRGIKSTDLLEAVSDWPIPLP